MLSVRRRGEEIQPAFAPRDDAHRALARDLVAAFQAHVGRRRADLTAALAAHEAALGPRYKLARGLATLLERRSAFEMATRLDPTNARTVVFEESARLEGGAATTSEARARVLASAAARMHATSDEVERALSADAEESLVLVAFDPPPDPDALLRRYNLGLAQTLLFDATRMEVDIESGFRSFLGLVKLHGLMHVVTREEDGTHRVAIDGPASLFRDTRRYGTAMAKTLPGLASCGRWRLAARVRDPYTGEDRVFRATSRTLPLRDVAENDDGDDDDGEGRGAPADEPPAFDSAVERRFAEGWASLRGPWRLAREPAALQATGGELFIPDFGFAWRDGPPRAFLEIVGYWTPAYLQRKLDKLRALPRAPPLLLAVDQALGVGAEAFADAPADVLLYKGEVPLAPVVQWLRRHEEAFVEEEADLLVKAVDAAALREAPVVAVSALARAHGVSPAAVERALPRLALGERARIGDALVAPVVLRELEKKLAPGMRVAEVEALARARGVDDASSLLARLGYAVAWQGLDPSSAVIRRREG